MQTTFFIVDKKLNNMVTKPSAKSVAVYMLGRDCDNYFVVKSDESGVRIVENTSSDVFVLQCACDKA